MMYQNSNKEMVRELAAQTMKVHRLRNLMAGIAIALTMVLILAVCGAGVSTVQAILKESDMNPGPGTNGISFTGDEAVQKKLEALPQIEWADMTKLCTAGTPKNSEFSGMTVKFMGVDEGYYGHNYVDLISGSYPSGNGELLMSDTMAERLGMTTEPGQKFTVEITVQKNGKTQNVPVEMTISGFYDNPLRQIVGYEELYTTVDFQECYNPELGASSQKIYTKVEGLDANTSQQELISVLDGISQEIGGAAYTFISPANLTMIWAGGGALLLLIMLCGYFLIYNIFYISTVNDIRFIGSMRTIGMTGN